VSIWDDAKKNLVEWYSVTADKTTELAKVTSLRYDKFGLSRDIERQFSELGSLVYNGLREEDGDVLASPGVAALMERIAGLEKDLRAKEDEIGAVKKEHAGRKAAEAAAGGVSATVLNDPVLPEGEPESAILMEGPAGDALDAAETDAEEKDKDYPENSA